MSHRPTTILIPLSVLYGAAMRIRTSLYNLGVLHSEDVGVPVISVGNLTTGGTGKTPLVEWVARRVAATGKKVCVLTRGYGRENPGARVLVSDGRTINADSRLAGDEPRLLAESLLDKAAVISDADRLGAARWARSVLHSEVFVLDDAFQHRKIKRDLDILLIDATNPWGGAKLLPAGRLREPQKELRRADVVVITRAEIAPDLTKLLAEIQTISPKARIFEARTSVRRIAQLNGEPVTEELANLRAVPVGAFCGLGNSESFFRNVELDGWRSVLSRSFGDHHRYKQTDIDDVAKQAMSKGAKMLLTTTKDSVKLRTLEFPLPCYVLEIENQLSDEGRLSELILSSIERQ
jgi:tetraacyldisaccharide 4'-kinase